jgi:hypothetical protein
VLGRLVVKSCKNRFIAGKQFLKLLFLSILVLQPDQILLALQGADAHIYVRQWASQA